ncbi:hypothetical protein GGG16DRAFT_100370 [Schizophyllum commune]
MPELSPDDLDALTALTEVYGEGIVEQYAKATFPTVVIKLKNLSAKNASEWINIKRFTDWIVTASQDLDGTLPASQNDTTRALSNTPSASQGTPFRSRMNIPFNTLIDDASQTPTKASSYAASYRAPSSSLPPSSPPGYSPVREPLSPPPLSDSPDLPELFVPTLIEKRKRQSTGDSDMPIIISNPPSTVVKPKKKKKKAKAVSPKVVINRQTTARELVVLPVQPLPPYFDVPHDKNENHDALQQHKSNTRRTKVVALDDAECFVLGFNCKGVFHCSEFDKARLHAFERYEADEIDMKELFDAERDLSQHSAQSLATRVATFFHEANNEPCRKEGCKGVAVYRKFKSASMNYDGKEGFIGCSCWRPGDKNGDHRFYVIPRQISEHHIIELFKNNGRFDAADLVEADLQPCVRMRALRNGGKGKQICPYPHISEDKVVQGHMVHRACPARGNIYFPVDPADRRALVLLHNVPHNHPAPPPSKTTPMGETLYTQAVEKVADKTMLRVDMAPTTRDVFGSKLPSAVDPGLSSARKKRDIREREDLKEEDRYIHVMHDEGDTRIIVTMLKAGEWKEWEVVVWDARLERRVTVARIYCERETRVAFKRMWKYLWDTVERLTGERVKFHFLDGSGIKAIIVDGCKRQVEGLGDDLVERCLTSDNPDFAGKKQDPNDVVQYLLKTCITHFERKVDELAKVCEKEIIDKVRACQFVKTQAEADELVKYYKSCPQKCVRDWIADKEQAPWFLPSINEYLSKIPARIWYETDMTTNINESAHPFTNKMTGIGRPLAESIERARTADRLVFEQLEECAQRCVLLNTKNTFSDRHRANRLRQESRIRTKAEKASKEEQLAHLNDVIKDAQQQKKVLSQAGVKAPRAKKGSRGKNTPNAVEMRRSSSPPSPSPQRGNLEGAAFELSSSSFRAGGFDVVTGWGDLGSTDLNAQLLSELTGDVSTWDFGTFLAAPGPSLSTIPEQAPADSTPPASRASTWTPWSGSMTQSGSSQPATQSTAIGSAMQSLAVPSSRPPSGGVLGWSPDAV